MIRKMCAECNEFKGTSLLDRIYLENLKERRIILNEDIMPSVMDTVAMQIKRFNFEDEGKPIEERKPIELHINSYGGSVYDGFGIVNAIVTSKTPVHAYCDGYAMSMGLAIFAAAHKRFAAPYSTFMYHEISTMVYGKNEEIERVTVENKRLQKMYDSLILKNSNLTQKQLDSKRKQLKDWYFGAEDAKSFGLVHEILE